MLGIVFALAGALLLVFFSAPWWGWLLLAAVSAAAGMWPLWLACVWAAGCLVWIVPSWRMKILSRPAFKLFKNILPPLSATEQAAIDAGTVWWDAEIFNGKPDWRKLQNYRDPQLTEEEQSFIDNETETLCAMLNDWRYTHRDKDLPPEVWQYVKDNGFIAMIIEKKYGGRAFSETH